MGNEIPGQQLPEYWLSKCCLICKDRILFYWIFIVVIYIFSYLSSYLKLFLKEIYSFHVWLPWYKKVTCSKYVVTCLKLHTKLSVGQIFKCISFTDAWSHITVEAGMDLWKLFCPNPRLKYIPLNVAKHAVGLFCHKGILLDR